VILKRKEAKMERLKIGSVILAILLIFLMAAETPAFTPTGKEETIVPQFAPTKSTLIKQAELSQQKVWFDFKARYGGDWRVRWNELTGTPHRITGKGILLPGAESLREENIEQIARSFISENVNLFQVSSENLKLLQGEKHWKLWYVTFQQYYRNLLVYGGRVDFRFTEDGRLTVFGSDVYPKIDLEVKPTFSEEEALRIVKGATGFNPQTDEVLESKLFIYPREEEGKLKYHLAWQVEVKIKEPMADWVYFLDAHNGEVLFKENRIRYEYIFGTVTGKMLPEYYDEPLTLAPYKDERVDVTGVDADTTDPAGYYSIYVPGGQSRTVTSELKGPYVDVNYEDGADAYHSGSATHGIAHDFTWDTTGTAVGRRDEINVYYHVLRNNDYVKAIDPAYTGTDYMMPATVAYGTGYDNAFWDGYGIYFGEGGSYFRNLALFSDVIYHEYTHGVIDNHYEPAPDPPSDMHEGWADYWACTLNDDCDVGDGGLMLDGSPYLRTLCNTMRTPEDSIGEGHHDGQILGGAMWDARVVLGRSMVDTLYHYARYAFPYSWVDYLDEIILADDNFFGDGNPSNGSPHACEIYAAFGNHGIGPGACVVITHDPLPDTDDTLNPYPVVATIISYRDPLNPDSLLVYYSTGGGFTPLLMSGTGNPDEYEALIPPQPLGTKVSYYIFACDTSGNYNTHPAGAPENVHTFEIRLISPILLVDDDVGASYETYFKGALNNIGFANSYDIWTVLDKGSPSTSDLVCYEAVIWFTGNDRTTTLIAAEQDALKGFLDRGGKLFISGQDIGYDIGITSFYRNYLHALYLNDDTNDYTLTGITGDPIGNGLSITIQGGDGANNQNSQDDIEPNAGATKVFDYNSFQTGAIRYPTSGTTPHQVVYLSFGYEAINNQTHRDTVMARILSWLEVKPQPPVTITLDPDTTTVHRGGYLGITICLTNISDSTKTVQGWTEVTLPNGNPYPGNPVFWPRIVTLAPHETKCRHVRHYVPNTAPSGVYKYCGKLGTYPSVVDDEDCFDFRVTP